MTTPQKIEIIVSMYSFSPTLALHKMFFYIRVLNPEFLVLLFSSIFNNLKSLKIIKNRGK